MAKKKARPEIKSDNLDIIKKAITKKYGEVISKLSDHEDMVIPTVSTAVVASLHSLPMS